MDSYKHYFQFHKKRENAIYQRFSFFYFSLNFKLQIEMNSITDDTIKSNLSNGEFLKKEPLINPKIDQRFYVLLSFSIFISISKN